MEQMEILQALNWRYATKSFDPLKKLSSAQIEKIEECLRLTPSSFGLQGWGFVWVTDPVLRSQIRAASWNQAQVEQASHHLVLCRKMEFGEKEVDIFFADCAQTRGVPLESFKAYREVVLNFLKKMTADQTRHWMERQVYIALGNLMASVAVMGIDACPMEGINPAEYDRILGLAQYNLATVVACPVGHRAADDKYALLKKVRFPRQQLFISDPRVKG